MMWCIYFVSCWHPFGHVNFIYQVECWSFLFQGWIFFNLISFDNGKLLVIKLGDQNFQSPIDNHVRNGYTQCQWYLSPWRLWKKNQLHLNKFSKYLWHEIFMMVARYGTRWKQLVAPFWALSWPLLHYTPPQMWFI
jgi:hypothetical protein